MLPFGDCPNQAASELGMYTQVHVAPRMPRPRARTRMFPLESNLGLKVTKTGARRHGEFHTAVTRSTAGCGSPCWAASLRLNLTPARRFPPSHEDRSTRRGNCSCGRRLDRVGWEMCALLGDRSRLATRRGLERDASPASATSDGGASCDEAEGSGSYNSS